MKAAEESGRSEAADLQEQRLTDTRIITRYETQGMTYDEVRPFMGARCHVRMRCVACRDAHDLVGTVEPARLSGEVVVSGHTFSVENIESISLQAPPRRGRPRRVLFDFLRALPEANAGGG
jgi:hypothetical protein